MKNMEVSRLGRFVLAALAGVALGACGEDKTVDDGGTDASAPLRVEQIIVNPKAAAAGDTVFMTADVRSSSQNEGDIPSLAWTATGGTFVEDDMLTVRWVAPATSDIYTVTARATNSAGAASGDADVLVAGVSALVAKDAGAVTLISGGPDFYFRFSTGISAGTDVYQFSAGIAGDATPPAAAKDIEVAFASDVSFEAHSADTAFGGPPIATLVPRHIYVSRFGSGTYQRITVDGAGPSERRHQYSRPGVSPNNHLVTFQGWQPDRFNTAIDSFNIFVYDLAQNTRLNVTVGQPVMHNLFPTFSTDQKWLTFVADPSGRSRWELYGAPVSGDVVDANVANLVQLSSTGGSIVSGSPAQASAPLRAWNPVSPDLAIVAKDGTLYIIQTSASGGATLDVTGLPGTALEMVWAPGGTSLAVVPTGTAGAIYLVVGTSAAPLLTLPAGDFIRDLVWSPDEAWIVYRRTRGGSSWFELVDVDAGQRSVPIALTGNWPTGDIVKYRAVMSMSPAWGSGNQLVMPAFGVSPTSATPGIITINISGAIQ